MRSPTSSTAPSKSIASSWPTSAFVDGVKIGSGSWSDSSRFWPADQYEPGRGQPSFDKQFVRDWASSTGWDRTPPAPPIPDDVVARTREKYVEAYERITGERFAEWLERTRSG